MFVSRSAVNINVLDGRRGDCATRHSAALRAVALARARCTLSPLCLFVRQPALHYAAHLYHHEQPHFSVPVYRRLRVLRHRHLHSPGARCSATRCSFIVLARCSCVLSQHIVAVSSENLSLCFISCLYFCFFFFISLILSGRLKLIIVRVFRRFY